MFILVFRRMCMVCFQPLNFNFLSLILTVPNSFYISIKSCRSNNGNNNFLYIVSITVINQEKEFFHFFSDP